MNWRHRAPYSHWTSSITSKGKEAAMAGTGEQTSEGARSAEARHVVAARKSASGRTSASVDDDSGGNAGKGPAKGESGKKKAAARKPKRGGGSTPRNAKVAPERLAVRADEEPWTEEELAEVRELLSLEAARLREEISDAEDGIAEMLRTTTDVGGEDQADAGSKTFEREHEMSLAASHREILGQTERALTRIDNGTYGVCENCGNPIGKARLQAFPRATLCVRCREREERR